MTTLTTTVLFDKNNDGAYEVNATADALSVVVNYGRKGDFSQCAPGTCQIVLDNNAGSYSPRNSGLRPLDGVQIVTESQNIFHGFIRRIFQHPEGDRRQVVVDCADWLYILSRTDVSLPMMRDVRSDLVISRILDFSEVGEHVDNPRFKDDLTGYTDVGAATGVRVTTGHLLEGLAACDVSGVTNNNDGIRYTIPHAADSEFQGVEIIGTAYVWSEDEADIGGGVRVEIWDNLAVRATSGSVLLTASPQRVSTTGTFNGAATDFYINIVGTPASAATAFRIGAVHAATSYNAIPRDVDRGLSYFENVSPHRVNALRTIQKAAENELGGLVYVDESGTLTFESKDTRWVLTRCITSNTTLDESMVALSLEEDAADLVGEVEIGYVLWEIGDAGAIIFQLFPVPRPIGANATITLDVDYGALVRDPIEPVANTDYFIRSTPAGDSAGSDETGNVTMTFDDFGEGAQIVLTSTVAYPTFLTNLRIRGTPVRTSSDNALVSYEPAGAPAVASKLRFRYGWQSNPAAAQTWAEYLGDRYVTQRERIPVGIVNKTAALTTQQTTRLLSDRVTLTNNNAAYSTMINGDYYIDHIRQRFAQGATGLETVWTCVPVDASYAIWDSASWDGSAPWAP